MPCDIYIGRWKIIITTGECPMGSHVFIDQKGELIIVNCEGGKTYEGTCQNTSIDLGESLIQLQIVPPGSPKQITFGPKKVGTSEGSWTAVDHPTGPTE